MLTGFYVGKIYKRKPVSDFLFRPPPVFILILNVIEQRSGFIYVTMRYINLSTLKIKTNDLYKGGWELVE